MNKLIKPNDENYVTEELSIENRDLIVEMNDTDNISDVEQADEESFYSVEGLVPDNEKQFGLRGRT